MAFLRVVLVCVSVAFLLAAEPGKVEKGQRKMPRSADDLADKFKGESGQGVSSKQNVRLSTTRVEDVFDDATNQTRSQFDDILSSDEKEKLTDMRNLACPDGRKVFNLSYVPLRHALQAADVLARLMKWDVIPNGPSNGLPNGNVVSNNTGLQGQQGQILQGQGQMDQANGLQFLTVVCVTQDTAATLDNTTRGLQLAAIQLAFNPTLLALLSDPIARRAADALPAGLKTRLCERLREADTAEIIRVARYFPCKEQLKELAESDPLVAEALLQEERKKQPADIDWDTIMNDFGELVPRDLLEKAPPNKVQEHLSKVLDKDTAPALLPKLNFTAMNATDVTSLGDKACSALPLSSVLKIPKAAIDGAGKAMKCIGEGDNMALKKKMAKKLMPSRNATTCKKFLADVDPLDEKCWKQLSPADVQAFNFSQMNKSEVPCVVAATLKEKLGLEGNLSTWNRSRLQEFPWLLRCAGLGSLTKADVDAMAQEAVEGQLEDPELQPSVTRKVFKKAKQTLNQLNDTVKLMKVKGLLGAMTASDVDQIPANLVRQALPELKDDFRKMPKAARRKLMDKLQPDQLKDLLCALGELDADIPANTIMTMSVNLGEKLTAENCSFRCRNDEQCSAIYIRFKEALGNGSMTWENATRDLLLRARDTGAICGIPVEEVTELSADSTLKDIAAAFFGGGCSNKAAAQMFLDKVILYNIFVGGMNMSEFDVQLLGGNFFKNMDPDELQDYADEVKKSIVQSLGQVDLDDVDSDWLKSMASLALRTLLKNDNADINSTTVLWLGGLVCGLTEAQVARLTPDALTDAADVLGACPDQSVDMMARVRQEMKNKMSLDYSQMDVSDLSLGGNLLLSDCDNLDTIPDEVKSDAVPDLVQAASKWSEKRRKRNDEVKDSASQQRQAQVEDKLRCGLRKVMEARRRYRTQQGGQTNRKRRSTEPVTCADIQLLGEYASILTVQQIASLSDTDFGDCADALGSVTTWTQEQKQALAAKAKQVWGPASTWSAYERLLTAGTIAQGLTPEELSSMSFSLEDISAMGQYNGWTEQQLETVFGKWFSNVTAKPESITDDHLRQLGHFVCGIPAGSIPKMTSQAYRGAMSEIGDVTCSMDKTKAWAGLAVQALGSVTSWTLPQTAAVDRVMAGLPGKQLSLMTHTQLSLMDLDTFASIQPKDFASLTEVQLKGLSVGHAQSVTADQYQYLNPGQKQALADLGAVYSEPDKSASAGMTTSVPVLVLMAVGVLLASG